MTLDELVRLHLRDLLKFEARRTKHLLGVYRELVRDLSEQLAEMPPETFQAKRYTAILAQLEAGTVAIEHGVEKALSDDVRRVQQWGVQQALAEISFGEVAHAAVPGITSPQLQAFFAPVVNTAAMVAQRDVRYSTRLWKEDQRKAIRRTVYRGIATAQHPKKLAEDLKKQLIGAEEWKVERIARTEFWRAATLGHRVANEAVHEAHPELGYEHEWVAILDRRGCEVCKALDGMKRPIGKPFVAHGRRVRGPIVHPHCRCRLRVWSARWDEEPSPIWKALNDPNRVKAPDPWSKPLGAASTVDRRFRSRNNGRMEESTLKVTVPAADLDFERAKKGTHFGDIRSPLSGDENDKILRGIQSAGLTSFLRNHPVGDIEVLDGLKHPSGAPLYGQYSRKDGSILIRRDRPAGSFGQPFIAGRMYSVSSSGTDLAAALQRTLVHELGHHVHAVARKLSHTAIKMIEDAWLRASPVTQLAGDTPGEYFAECFAAYTFHRKALKEFDPGGYKMVEDVRREMGIDE